MLQLEIIRYNPLKKTKRKTSNALEVFLYNCATRFKGRYCLRQSPAGARHIKKSLTYM